MRFRFCCAVFMAILTTISPLLASAAEKSPRARDLGIPFEGLPGPLNAITDVAGVDFEHDGRTQQGRFGSGVR